MPRSKIRVTVPSSPSVLKDPRFYVGVLIIALSILGCTLIVVHARNGISVYQVTQNIVPGEEITDANTRIVQARPESLSYVAADTLPRGSLAVHALGKDELIPTRSVTTKEDRNYRRLVLDVAFGIPQSIVKGTKLELWSIPQGKNGVNSGSAQTPTVLTTDAVLIQVIDNKGLAGNLSQQRIEVRLPDGDVPLVLSATGRSSTLAAVTVGQ